MTRWAGAAPQMFLKASGTSSVSASLRSRRLAGGRAESRLPQALAIGQDRSAPVLPPRRGGDWPRAPHVGGPAPPRLRRSEQPQGSYPLQDQAEQTGL